MCLSTERVESGIEIDRVSTLFDVWFLKSIRSDAIFLNRYDSFIVLLVWITFQMFYWPIYFYVFT